MKFKLITLAAAALLAGSTFAAAQTMGNPSAGKGSVNPSSPNAGPETSGTQKKVKKTSKKMKANPAAASVKPSSPQAGPETTGARPANRMQ